MNTFLPYKSFVKSAKCLDYKRLGKQRVEVWQIYQTLQKGQYQFCKCGCNEIFNGFCVGCYSKVKKTAWYNHPIVQMWKNFEIALLCYGIAICDEWRKRGYTDNLGIKFLLELRQRFGNKEQLIYPIWLGNHKFHSAMRSNLLRKDKEYYSKFHWKEKDNLPYYWIKEKMK